ncbi:TfoX/Sxy family protein [Bacteroidales bacterium OttesenSCG-928-I21]|nr:TfoX/Sxy family protein [Bacteroidales bacterium OttesenSCG-928-I21]
MTAQNNDLTSLPNIGKVLSDKLKVVGIDSVEKLQSVGSENTFIRLKTIDNDVCINTLCALEGAIQGIRWHNLDKYKKEELKIFFEMTKRIDKK